MREPIQPVLQESERAHLLGEIDILSAERNQYANELGEARAERGRYRETLRRAHGYITDLGDDGNEGAALLARRIAEDLGS